MQHNLSQPPPSPPNYRRNEKRDIDKLPSNQTQPEGLKIRELIECLKFFDQISGIVVSQ